MNDSEIIDKLSCLICFRANILFIPLPLYYTIDKTKTPWQKKVDLLLYPHCLVLKNSNEFRDYFCGIIRWENFRSIAVESKGSLNLLIALIGSTCVWSYLSIFFTLKLFFSPELAAKNLFPIIAGLLNGLLVGTLLFLQLPNYYFRLKTDSQLYVLTLKNSSDFATMKSFAEKIVETINS